MKRDNYLLIEKLRHELHQHPELSYNETWTKRHLIDFLKQNTSAEIHDCGKYCSAKEQLKLCEKYKITLTDLEHSMPALIHAKLGAYLAENEYGIKDREVLDAITYHTTGRPEMTMLEKILYIADYIEPNRREIPGLSKIRQIVFQNIDQAICLSSERTIRYLEDNGNKIDPMTIKTYEFYGGKL